MTLVVNGLPLPAVLVEAIGDGVWRAPAGPEVYVRVFGEEAVAPEFYDERAMRRENDGWADVSRDDFACAPGPGGNLGVDPVRSVIIAGLGPDMPVVLDYRRSPENPRVLYVRGDRPRWVEVAADVAELLARLGLR
ncbi:hypothetical protein [Spirilliplanes yamanashiensis]|uniref:Uncharacterized protein n=1 Tax=Spirilliplanes yamanashiensis TaxID=42233 RepID=A0A8J4DHP6_9ACTN|nr:hypothetical protein [Spirilliplanes yamanashiensis]MDP9819861.1 hypothetical protein [Spirilliplanes yamanashiensis]GIJ01320.1 hypothetical protein Sya03_06720 [Spirilliplanes yamanashiensis]